MDGSNNNSSKINPTISRKDFLGKSAAVAAGFFIVPRYVLGGACQNEKETGQPARQLEYTTSWLGNSYPAAPVWVQTDLEDLYVTPDGTVFTIVPFREGAKLIGKYVDGELVAQASYTANTRTGSTITANTKYLYCAFKLRGKYVPYVPEEESWYGVIRVNVSDIETADPFEGGYGANEGLKPIPYNSFLKIHAVASGSADIQGLSANEEYLAVSDPYEGRIMVYNAMDMQFIREWHVANTDEVAIDANNRIWAIQKETNKILNYDINGNLLKEINLPAGTDASDVAMDNQSRLMVADEGDNEYILVYSNLGGIPSLHNTIGVKGGIYNGVEGKWEDMQFLNLKGIGKDSNGNLYVGMRPAGQRTLIQSYTPSGALRWQREGMVFQEGVGVDPDNQNIIYTANGKHIIDYSKNGKLDELYSFTDQQHKYSDDPRSDEDCSQCQKGKPFIRKLSNGKKYMYLIGGGRTRMSFYRFDGEIVVPAGFFDESELWVDQNGNGQEDQGERVDHEANLDRKAKALFVDSEGSIWYANLTGGIYRFKAQGFGPNGIPLYDVNQYEHYPMPEPFTEIRRIYFYPERDNLLMINGFTADNPNDGDWNRNRGGKVIRMYNNWSPGNYNLAWEVVPPFEYKVGCCGGDGNIQGIDLAGDYMFVGRNGSSVKLGINRGHVDVYNFKAQQYMGWMEPNAGWTKTGIMDMVNAIEAIQRPNGEYFVFFEDNGKSKQIVYRWRPKERKR